MLLIKLANEEQKREIMEKKKNLKGRKKKIWKGLTRRERKIRYVETHSYFYIHTHIHSHTLLVILHALYSFRHISRPDGAFLRTLYSIAHRYTLIIILSSTVLDTTSLLRYCMC